MGRYRNDYLACRFLTQTDLVVRPLAGRKPDDPSRFRIPKTDWVVAFPWIATLFLLARLAGAFRFHVRAMKTRTSCSPRLRSGNQVRP